MAILKKKTDMLRLSKKLSENYPCLLAGRLSVYYNL